MPSILRKKIRVPLLLLSIALLAIVGRAAIPLLHANVPNMDPRTREGLLMEAAIVFDAPLLELIELPIFRVTRFTGTEATITVYSWFGIRVGTVHLAGCEPNVQEPPYVSCQSASVRW